MTASDGRALDWPMFPPRGCRISDEWVCQGMRTVILENDWLRVVILIDKGSDIVEFRYKPYDLNFLLERPIRAPRSGDSLGSLAFIDYYSGGWNEILPNGGAPAVYQGAPLGQHGEISLAPWRHAIITDTPDQVAVKLRVRAHRTPFYLEKTLTMQADKAALFIHERLTNEAGEPLHCMWGQHIAFGNPFLLDGAVIQVPAKRLLAHPAMDGYEPRRFKPGSASTWPHARAANGGDVDASIVPPYGGESAQEMAYLTELTDGWYAITNQARRVGFGLHFDQNLYRYLWYWQQLGNVAKGYPWWGRLHTTGLEPWTSYPTNGLPDAIENGTALLLQPGETVETRLCAVAYSGVAYGGTTPVSAITESGDVIAAGKETGG